MNEEQDVTFFSRSGEYLEDVFTLNDFLHEPTTKDILENDRRQQFVEHVEPKIIKFHKEIKNVMCEHTSLFHLDNRNTAINEITNLIYKNITKKYNLEIFYENPRLASVLLKKE